MDIKPDSDTTSTLVESSELFREHTKSKFTRWLSETTLLKHTISLLHILLRARAL